MNWTAEFARHSKAKKELKKKGKGKTNRETDKDATKRDLKSISEAINTAVQTEESTCLECIGFAESLSRLESHLFKLDTEKKDLQQKLSQTKNTLGITIDRENKLREEHERVLLEEAQVRYELTQLQKDLTSKLSERDDAHSERIKLMEQLLEERGIEWARRNEELQRDLRQALRSSLYDTEREAISVTTLEQELSSLHAVIEMRSLENRDLRSLNNELVCRLERQAWFESELNNARQRLDEMTEVVQNKMTSERELLELSETLQQQLVQSREELMHFRRELENRQYLYENNQKNVGRRMTEKSFIDKSFDKSFEDFSSSSGEENRPHRNQHQQARSSSYGIKDPTVVLDVREKMDSVAWLIQLPTSTPEKSNRERK